jgi:hypothetical protein
MKLKKLISLMAVPATATLFALTFAGAPMVASAGHVGCGDTIVTDTTLDADLDCTLLGRGLYIGAKKVTLDLGGFTIFGNPTTGTGVSVCCSPIKGVTIRNGTIDGFDLAIDSNGARDLTLTHLEFTGQTDFSSTGVNLFDSSNVVIKHSVFLIASAVTDPTDQTPQAIVVNRSNDVVINNVDVHRYRQGVNVQPASSALVKNSTFTDTLIPVFAHADANELKVSANHMSGCLDGTIFMCIGIIITSPGVGSATGELLINNNFIHDMEGGVNLSGVTNAKISGNHVRDNSGGE